MIKRIFIFILLLSAGSHSVFPQSVDFNDRCAQAYENILCLELVRADSLLALEKSMHPENVYVPYLQSYIDFVRLFVSQDEELYHNLNDRKDACFKSVDQLEDSSPYKKWMLGNMHLQWSLTKMIFGELLAGSVEFARAYYLIDENVHSFPAFKPNMLSMGVLHVIVGLVPDKYDWILGLLSMNGEVEQGKRELAEFITLTKQQKELGHWHDEALFYSGFIEMNIHTDKERLSDILNETEKTDVSVLLIKFLEINILMRTGENEEALKLLKKVEANGRTTCPFAYLDYLYGESLLRSMRTMDAAAKYDLFLNSFKGKNYVKDAWRKKAWAAYLNNDTLAYYAYMLRVKETGTERLDIDKEALSEAKRKQLPDKDLLKARLLFDGGYFDEVLVVLGKMDTTTCSREQKVGYVYRLGRTYDKLGQMVPAKKYYRLTIQKGQNLDTYYAANAALKLAEIYEREGDKIRAKENYELCLHLEFKTYANAIRVRAKEGLKRISEE